jgi:hypothetical protein
MVNEDPASGSTTQLAARLVSYCPSVFASAASHLTVSQFSRYLRTVCRLVELLDEHGGDRVKAEDALYDEDKFGLRLLSEVEVKAIGG